MTKLNYFVLVLWLLAFAMLILGINFELTGTSSAVHMVLLRYNNSSRSQSIKKENNVRNKISNVGMADSRASISSNQEMVGGGLCPPKDQPMPPLAFIHIRKTGGTAIEVVSKEKGYQWGIDAAKNWSNLTLRLEDYIRATRRTKEGNKWHIPPKFFEPYPFQNISTFAVTRNPYERVISEYYQKVKFCTVWDNFDVGSCESFYRHHQDRIGTNDPRIMNEIMQDYLLNPVDDMFYPQYDYIFDDDGNRIVNHVLEFSRLKTDFDALMKCYGINMTLPSKHINARLTTSMLNRRNLSNESVSLINKYMKKDFELFGYPMIDRPKFENQSSQTRVTGNRAIPVVVNLTFALIVFIIYLSSKDISLRKTKVSTLLFRSASENI